MQKQLEVIEHGPGDALTDLAMARALLASVQQRHRGALIRIYQPQLTAVFGARDRFLAGFPQAIEAARTHGFTPALRTLGGRLAAYHEHSLVVDHLAPDDDFLTHTHSRFERFAQLYAEALRSIGVPAAVGPIPGEYCPGEHSVNVAGRIKVIGTAQRVVKGAWLFSSSIVIANPAPIRSGLTSMQEALGIAWDPRTGGAISEITPGIKVADVSAALLATYGRDYDLVSAQLEPADLQAASALVPGHRL